MRRSVALFALAASALAAQSAGAGTLVNAQFTFEGFGAYPTSFTSTGPLLGSASGTGVGATWSVGAGDVPTGFAHISVATSAAPPVEHFQLIVNGNPLGGGFVASSNGSMPVTGLYKVIAYGGLTLLGIPISVGAPTVVTPPVVSGIGITALANAWTTKTTTIVPTNTVVASQTAMGSNGLVNGGGTVVLVSALNVLTSIAGQGMIFATLTLTYAPDVVAEPGMLLGLGTAIAGLLLVGRQKRRR